MSKVSVMWTPRFRDRFRRYNGISDFVIKKTAELVKKANANPTNWHYELEKLRDESLVAVLAYRFKITSGDRLIIVINGSNLVLADIGDHDVMDSFSKMPKRTRDRDLAAAEKVD